MSRKPPFQKAIRAREGASLWLWKDGDLDREPWSLMVFNKVGARGITLTDTGLRNLRDACDKALSQADAQ